MFPITNKTEACSHKDKQCPPRLVGERQDGKHESEKAEPAGGIGLQLAITHPACRFLSHLLSHSLRVPLRQATDGPALLFGPARRTRLYFGSCGHRNPATGRTD